MNAWSWDSQPKLQPVAEVRRSHFLNSMDSASTRKPDTGPCLSSGHRRCSDGSCIARVDLCPEDKVVNQNTILIMVVVGMAVVVFLLLLYCFQQRAQRFRQQQDQSRSEVGHEDGDNASLNMPPPTYDEVINTNLYPPTPVLQRNIRIPSSEEPITPPPNYDTALTILANSLDSVVPSKSEPKSPVVRRSVSTDFSLNGGARSSRSSESDYRRFFSSQDPR
ncbi:uncharacterized protein LOC101860334 [Aplysia californica]|uniref:Uncharacterized protein LOC101860334 n=1 Tax=Aplysia californica TaxID=6500 RepID=A0ABM0JR68_APLCA|nr:uncharacterized protein LOC101860334 [Aplysia californica]